MQNRELKFRIYSYIDKSFHYFDIYNYPDGIAGGVSEPQQYTEIDDKNNKPIYDGDILSSGLNYYVYWDYDKWMAACPYYCKYHWPKFEYFRRDARASLIIGNIIENPELISYEKQRYKI